MQILHTQDTNKPRSSASKRPYLYSISEKEIARQFNLVNFNTKKQLLTQQKQAKLGKQGQQGQQRNQSNNEGLSIKKGHFLCQKINCNIEYEALMFSQVLPNLHKNYISEVAKSYNKIAPIRIKNIVPIQAKLQQMPKIESMNYFASKCDFSKMRLCYLIPKTSTLAFYMMADISQNSVTNLGNNLYRQAVLPINWKFSDDTKTLVTPQGRIFAIGCQSTQQSVDKSLYEVNLEKIVRRTELPQSIRNPGFIYLNGYIYIIGGLVERLVGQQKIVQYSKKCYRYSIQNKKWTELKESNIAISKPTLCTFNNRFIFKFAGLNQFDYINKIVEVFDTVMKEWSLVRVTPQNTLQDIEVLQDASAIQINQNHIYIFGGKNCNRFSSDTGYLFNITEMGERSNKKLKVSGELCNISVGKRNFMSLGGIYSQGSVIIHERCLYGLRVDYIPTLY